MVNVFLIPCNALAHTQTLSVQASLALSIISALEWDVQIANAAQMLRQVTTVTAKFAQRTQAVRQEHVLMVFALGNVIPHQIIANVMGIHVLLIINAMEESA